MDNKRKVFAPGDYPLIRFTVLFACGVIPEHDSYSIERHCLPTPALGKKF